MEHTQRLPNLGMDMHRTKELPLGIQCIQHLSGMPRIQRTVLQQATTCIKKGHRATRRISRISTSVTRKGKGCDEARSIGLRVFVRTLLHQRLPGSVSEIQVSTFSASRLYLSAIDLECLHTAEP